MRMFFPLFFTCFFIGWISEVNAFAKGPCDICDPIPKFKTGPEDPSTFDAACQKQRKSYQCGVTSESLACTNAKLVDKALADRVKAKKELVCTKVREYCEAQNSCTASGASECFSNSGAKLTEVKRTIDSAVADLEELVKNVESWRTKMLDEIREAAETAKREVEAMKSFKDYVASGAEGPPPPKPCLENGHDNKPNYDPHPREEGIRRNGGDPASNPPSNLSDLDQSYVVALGLIRLSKENTNKEIANLRKISAGLSPMQKTSLNRGKGLNSNNPQSTITGGDKNPSSNSPASPPQQDSKGGGAGSGSGSGGGGSPSGSPSSVSNASPPMDPNGTSPTPDGQNTGARVGTGEDPAKVGSGEKNFTNNPTEKLNVDRPTDKVDTGRGLTGLGVPSIGSGSIRNENSAAARGRNGGSSASHGKVSGGGDGGAGASGGDLASAPASTGNAGAANATDSSGSSGGGGGGGYGGGSFGSEEALSPFGKPLGDPKFTLAGSETDASVKNLVGELTPEEEAGARDLASEVDDGIGIKDSISLFERIRNFSDRCMQKGCVTAVRKRKVGGG